MFEREDWTAFRSLETLPQKAGVPIGKLPKLVAKELVDNALDAAGKHCGAGSWGDNGFFVQDLGDGIPGSDVEVASLFSIRRPLTSTKILRRPSRGALGNGLRVVAGAVLASGGTLTVATRGRTLRLMPRDDGGTLSEVIGPFPEVGTRVEVQLGAALPLGGNTLDWAREAIELAGGGPRYSGKTSPHWYDPDAFFELLQAAGRRTVRELIAELDGCAEPKAGKVAAGFQGQLARELDRAQADQLLLITRAQARLVKPARLGFIGPMPELPTSYARRPGALAIRSARPGPETFVPIVLEVWAELAARAELRVTVNRTPIASEIDAYHVKDELIIMGCGLDHALRVGRKPARVRLNIETPYMPITSDGKAPDLLPFAGDIAQLATRVIRQARRGAGVGVPGTTQKDIILEHLTEAVARASGEGQYRFSLRQLFYAVRPFLIEALGKEPEYDYFGQVITEREAELGEVTGIYRDPRGTLYHPHTGEELPLGTLAAERYRRPAWTFNKILYCEKEGFFPILRAARWPERNDCALMTSKGFASRAARDVLDLLGDSGEGLSFFCIHDADAYGTMIYQALQQGTLARPGRRVQIINLGLDPAEATAMGLQVEQVNRKGARVAPVADYVDVGWFEWLQTRRVELNAMTTPQFLEWLDRKLAPYAGKVVPPAEVLVDHLEAAVRAELGRRITARVLRRARVEERVERAYRKRGPTMLTHAATIEGDVQRGLELRPTTTWGEPVHRIATTIVARG